MVPAPAYLLDTNTASFIIRGGPPQLMTRLRAQPVTAIGISAITEAELLYGLARKPSATALATAVAAFLRHVQTLPWDSEAAISYGSLRAALEYAGTPLGGMDMLIAAHTLALDATLVTNDHAFRRVPSLRVEDWTADS